MATLPWYASREAIASAFDAKTTAYLSDTIDRLAEQASRTIERETHRIFYPSIETKVYGRSGRALPLNDSTLWLEDDLLSLTSISVDGTTVTDAAVQPALYGAPYNRVDFIDASSIGGEVATIVGVWGFSQDLAPAGALSGAISSTSATTCTVSNSALVGVGDQLLIDSERVVVTGKASSDTTANTAGALTASAAETTVPVNTGSLVKIGETITIDSERMRVLDIASNNLLVRRAVDGSVLATHANPSDVYAPRLLTISRANAGTTAATHSDAATVQRNVPPPLVTELAIAIAQATLGQEQAGWNLTIGEGEGQRESTGKQLGSLRREVDALYRRKRTPTAV